MLGVVLKGLFFKSSGCLDLPGRSLHAVNSAAAMESVGLERPKASRVASGAPNAFPTGFKRKSVIEAIDSEAVGAMGRMLP